MKIVKSRFYLNQLKNILRYIAIDNNYAALAFERELHKKIKILSTQPLICRPSIYHENDAYRDLIYKSYTVIFKVEQETIILLDKFKWQDRTDAKE